MDLRGFCCCKDRAESGMPYTSDLSPPLSSTVDNNQLTAYETEYPTGTSTCVQKYKQQQSNHSLTFPNTVLKISCLILA